VRIERFAKLEQDTKEVVMSLTNSVLSARTVVIDNFSPESTAVFVHRSDLRGLVYEAVNDSCPNYFLAEQCVSELKSLTNKRLPVIATIIMITPCRAPKSNPFNLPEGTQYYEVLARQIDPKHSSSAPDPSTH